MPLRAMKVLPKNPQTTGRGRPRRRQPEDEQSPTSEILQSSSRRVTRSTSRDDKLRGVVPNFYIIQDVSISRKTPKKKTPSKKAVPKKKAKEKPASKNQRKTANVSANSDDEWEDEEELPPAPKRRTRNAPPRNLSPLALGRSPIRHVLSPASLDPISRTKKRLQQFQFREREETTPPPDQAKPSAANVSTAIASGDADVSDQTPNEQEQPSTSDETEDLEEQASSPAPLVNETDLIDFNSLQEDTSDDDIFGAKLAKPSQKRVKRKVRPQLNRKLPASSDEEASIETSQGGIDQDDSDDGANGDGFGSSSRQPPRIKISHGSPIVGSSTTTATDFNRSIFDTDDDDEEAPDASLAPWDSPTANSTQHLGRISNTMSTTTPKGHSALGKLIGAVSPEASTSEEDDNQVLNTRVTHQDSASFKTPMRKSALKKQINDGPSDEETSDEYEVLPATRAPARSLAQTKTQPKRSRVKKQVSFTSPPEYVSSEELSGNAEEAMLPKRTRAEKNLASRSGSGNPSTRDDQEDQESGDTDDEDLSPDEENLKPKGIRLETKTSTFGRDDSAARDQEEVEHTNDPEHEVSLRRSTRTRIPMLRQSSLKDIRNHRSFRVGRSQQSGTPNEIVAAKNKEDSTLNQTSLDSDDETDYPPFDFTHTGNVTVRPSRNWSTESTVPQVRSPEPEVVCLDTSFVMQVIDGEADSSLDVTPGPTRKQSVLSTKDQADKSLARDKQNSPPLAAPPARSIVKMPHNYPQWTGIEKAYQKPCDDFEALKSLLIEFDKEHRKHQQFPALEGFLKSMEDSEESADSRMRFLHDLVPGLMDLAQLIPTSMKSKIGVLRNKDSENRILNQGQVGSILANAFFCNFPNGDPDMKYGGNFIVFSTLFGAVDDGPGEGNAVVRQKLKCLHAYLAAIVDGDPTDQLTFQRTLVTTAPIWGQHDQDIRMIDVVPSYETSSRGVVIIRTSGLVGGDVFGFGVTEEETAFLVHPELLVARLFVEPLDEDEVLIVSGVRKYSELQPGNTFQFKKQSSDLSPRYFAFIRHPSEQVEHTVESLISELNKLYFVMSIIKVELPGKKISMGVSNYGGVPSKRIFEAVLVLMAASVAQTDVTVCIGDDKPLGIEVDHVMRLLQNNKQVDVQWVFEALVAYQKLNSWKRPSLYFFLASRL